jgi:hypothetical protein
LGVGPDTGPTSYSPNIVFVGSEDQDVIDDVIEWGKKNRYRVLYTNLFDRRNVSAGLNFTQQVFYTRFCSAMSIVFVSSPVSIL